MFIVGTVFTLGDEPLRCWLQLLFDCCSNTILPRYDHLTIYDKSQTAFEWWSNQSPIIFVTTAHLLTTGQTITQMTTLCNRNNNGNRSRGNLLFCGFFKHGHCTSHVTMIRLRQQYTEFALCLEHRNHTVSASRMHTASTVTTHATDVHQA